MTAVPKASEAPVTHNLIERFRDQYNSALDDVRVSQEHTDTEGWQRLYKGHRTHEREARRDMAKRLAALTKTLEDYGWNEDDEKAVKDIAKLSAENRAAAEAFENQTVAPVREPILTCDRLIDTFTNDARRLQADAPLHNAGLLESMKAETATAIRPAWDSETGTIKIRST